MTRGNSRARAADMAVDRLRAALTPGGEGGDDDEREAVDGGTSSRRARGGGRRIGRPPWLEGPDHRDDHDRGEGPVDTDDPEHPADVEDTDDRDEEFADDFAPPVKHDGRPARGGHPTWSRERPREALVGRARIGLDGRSLTVVVIAAVVIGALAGWGLVRDDGDGDVSAPPVPVLGRGTEGAGGGGTSEAAPRRSTPVGGGRTGGGVGSEGAGTAGWDGRLVVSVQGRVARPGLVDLDAGARVADAVAAAGGVVDGADLTGLNLARRLDDGDQVIVGEATERQRPGSEVQSAAGGGTGTGGNGGGAAAPGPAGGTVDLNRAGAAELESLPGIGPVTAAAILAWREANGRFTSIEQLVEVDGIGPARLERLRPRVRV